MKKYYLTILVLFFALATYANTPYFLRINSEIDGLSHNAIRCLLQDSRGYVWIGTQMGLNRFDGTRIKTFKSDKFPSAYIFSLCEDHKGNIWIGTGNGIVVYDYEYDRFFEPLKADGTKFNAAIHSIACNRNGEIWFDARQAELYSFNYNDGFIRSRNIELGHKTIKRLAFNHSDCLVICSRLDNVYMYNGRSKAEPVELISGGELLKNDELCGPVFNKKHKSVFYVATKHSGLVEVNLIAKRARTILNWKAYQRPTSIAIQDDRYIVVATTSGLVRYDLLKDHKEEYYNIPNDRHSLSDDYLLCTMVDNNSGIWVGTAQYGVCYT